MTTEKKLTKIYDGERHIADQYEDVSKAAQKRAARRSSTEAKYYAHKQPTEELVNELYQAWTGGQTVELTNMSCRSIITALIEMSETKILKGEQPSNPAEIKSLYKAIHHKHAHIKIGSIDFTINLKPGYAHTGNGMLPQLGDYGLTKKNGAADKKAILSIINRLTEQDSAKEKILAKLLLGFSENIHEISVDELKKAGLIATKEDAKKITVVAFLFCLFEIYRRKLPGYKETTAGLVKLQEHAFGTSQTQALKLIADGNLKMANVFEKKADYCVVTGVEKTNNKTLAEYLKSDPAIIDQKQDKPDILYTKKTLTKLDKKNLLQLESNDQLTLTAKGYRYSLNARSIDDEISSIDSYESDRYSEANFEMVNLREKPPAIVKKTVISTTTESVPSKVNNTRQPYAPAQVVAPSFHNVINTPQRNSKIQTESNEEDSLAAVAALLPVAMAGVGGYLGYKASGERHKLFGSVIGSLLGLTVYLILQQMLKQAPDEQKEKRYSAAARLA